jgi:hypothetical protein
MREGAEEVRRARELLERAVTKEIAGMHEDVAVGDLSSELVVEEVRVGERDDLDHEI